MLMKTFALMAPFAFALLSPALATETDMTDAQQSAIRLLRRELPAMEGFRVESIRTTKDGLTCVTYHTSVNGTERALVRPDWHVEHSGTDNSDFQKTWNAHCGRARTPIRQ